MTQDKKKPMDVGGGGQKESQKGGTKPAPAKAPEDDNEKAEGEMRGGGLEDGGEKSDS
jgi:hypothetical protein